MLRSLCYLPDDSQVGISSFSTAHYGSLSIVRHLSIAMSQFIAKFGILFEVEFSAPLLPDLSAFSKSSSTTVAF